MLMDDNIINLFNNLIHNKGLNIRKLYKLNNNLFKENLLKIKHMYCQQVTKKGNLCLNKCIENSNYCKRHEPYLDDYSKTMELLFEYNETENLTEKKMEEHMEEPIEQMEQMEPIPSAPKLEELEELESPDYEQKPDEVGNMIKNQIKTNKIKPIFNNVDIEKIIKEINNIQVYNKNTLIHKGLDIITKEDIDTDGYIGSYNIHLLNIKYIKDNNGNINELFRNLIPIKDGEPIKDIEEYKKNLLNINYSIYNNYQGINMRNLCRNILEFEFKLYAYSYGKNTVNSKLIKFINNIVKHIPK